jgi:hypothetical protein
MKISKNIIDIIFAFILVVCIAALIYMLSLPFIRKSGPGLITECGCNLRQIGCALARYASENDTQYPNDLLQLFPKYLNDYKVLICREGQKGLKRNLHDKETNYIYLPGLNSEAPDDCIVMFDKKNNHDNGRNVLCLEGFVIWHKEEEFKQELKRMLDDPTYKNRYSKKALDIMNGILEQK